MKARDDLDRLFDKIDTSLYSLDNEEFTKYFDKAYQAGQNKLYQKNYSETKKFDRDWVQTVESYFPSLDKIIKNPRSDLKYEEEVTAIEKAKRINGKSVRHLSSHTHFIKEVDENDQVIPKKILTTQAEMDFAVYENRFVATLINRLFLFVRNRYLIIKDNVESFQKDHVYTESNFLIDETKVDFKIDISLKRELEDKTVNEKNYELLERVDRLEKLVEGLRNTQFVKTLSKLPPIHPPIMKTNVILKNPDFKNAYRLWLFLDRYSAIAYDVDVKEKIIEFDPRFAEHIRDLTLVTFATIVGDQSTRDTLFNIDNAKEYTKISDQDIVANAEDFVENPQALQVEDTTLNEYFLNKYRELLDQSKEEIKLNGKLDDDEALKRALRKTTEIVNSLYESIFEFEAERNVFELLVTNDYEKEYEKYRYKAKFAKVIREIKEVDYNKQMRLEKKILKELERLNKKIIAEKNEIFRKSINSDKLDLLRDEVAKKREELEEIQSRLQLIGDNKTLLDHERDALDELREELFGQIKVETEAYEKEYRESIAKERDDLANEDKELKASIRNSKTELDNLIKLRDKLQKERIELEKKKARAEILEKNRLAKEEADRKYKHQIDLLRLLIKKQKEKLNNYKEKENKVIEEINEEKIKLYNLKENNN